jgi:hypothetical protein
MPHLYFYKYYLSAFTEPEGNLPNYSFSVWDGAYLILCRGKQSLRMILDNKNHRHYKCILNSLLLLYIPLICPDKASEQIFPPSEGGLRGMTSRKILSFIITLTFTFTIK